MSGTSPLTQMVYLNITLHAYGTQAIILYRKSTMTGN